MTVTELKKLMGVTVKFLEYFSMSEYVFEWNNECFQQNCITLNCIAVCNVVTNTWSVWGLCRTTVVATFTTVYCYMAISASNDCTATLKLQF